MNRIANLSQTKQTELIEILRSMAAYNQKRFFSDEFFQQVVDQLERNVNTAFAQHQGQLDFSVWWQQRRWRKQQLGAAWKQVINYSNTIDLVLTYRQLRLKQRVNCEQ
jgi:LmbE family N-acetylglucosaminyl deacetylase